MKSIKNRLLFNLSYFAMWVLYFLFARIFFLLFHFKKTSELGFLTTLKTFFYGIQLDLSFAGYLSIIPFLLILLSIFIPSKIASFLIKIFTYLTVFILTLLLLTDASLYSSWGVRIDKTLLTYINTPKIMLASVSGFQLFLGLSFWLILSVMTIRMMKKIINKHTHKLQTGKWVEVPVFLLVFGLLMLPIRGGLQTIPINQSNVYFSANMFANHAAINYMWNFSNALIRTSYDGKNPYRFFDDVVANTIIQKERKSLLTSPKDTILNTQKPNVILLIWESLSAKVVAPYGGEKNVTENLNTLSKEGLLFTNFYANGDRTDKGLIAILSGYYPQTNTSIIKMPSKTRSLPMLTKEMKKLGYTTSFYYGGDTNFGNMNTYLRNGEIDKIVDGSAFKNEDWNSKWGVHDHIFLEQFANDFTSEEKKPFFKIALTLTSHEPFEFPGTYKFGKDTEENKFRSAHAYTDKAIGNFIKFAKKQAWWNNTLIVIMGDHGHAMPKHKGYFNAPQKFTTPMLWLGGALAKKNETISTICSQTDFSYTLLNILGGDNSQFIWSKNIFNNTENQYAHYIFNNGFGTIDKNGVFVYDYVSNKAVVATGSSSKKLDSLGKAITQDAFQDFMNRK